jgi:L-lactate permease
MRISSKVFNYGMRATKRALAYTIPTALLAEYINTKYAMPAIVFYALASGINSLAWLLFIRSIAKPTRLLNDTFSHEEYNKLRASNRYAFVIYSSTALLAIWLPYTALTINLVLWAVWIYLSLMEKE